MPPDSWIRANTSMGDGPILGTNAGFPRREKPIEGFLRVGDVSARDQGTRNPRTARGFRRVVPARLKHGLRVQDDAERRSGDR